MLSVCVAWLAEMAASFYMFMRGRRAYVNLTTAAAAASAQLRAGCWCCYCLNRHSAFHDDLRQQVECEASAGLDAGVATVG